MKLVLICGCLMLVDCGRHTTSTTSSPSPETQRASPAQVDSPKPSDVLLKISFDGGLVPDKNKISGEHTGHIELVFTRAGNYSLSGDVSQKRKGVLSQAELDELTQRINSADYVALRSKSFTGTCPTANDGAEATYTFYTEKGIEVIASCKFEIDKKSALFVKVLEIQSKYNQ